MYNHFPNYAYYFLIRDSKKNFIPLDQSYHATAADLGHLYSTICDHYGFNAVTLIHPSDTTALIGREMFTYILSTEYSKPIADSFSINRVFLHLENEKIISNEIELYKVKVE